MRKIIHVDMDCFYAAVEVKHNPKLKGLPIGIGGPPNTRSVLCTASYEARKFGVRAAQPSSQAIRLCPDLILIPPHFDLYKQESRHVRSIFERFTDKIEPLSLDEAYLDVTEYVGPFSGSASLLAKEIRRLIQTELNLTASAGIAPNKFLAKVASDWRKPNGQFVIAPQDISTFMPSLKVEKIYGVGKVTAKRMHELNLFTCGDLQRCDLPFLTRNFGSRASELIRLSHGIDNREVQTQWERKSLTVEETFTQDLTTLDAVLAHVPPLYTEFERRLAKGQYASRVHGFVVKLKYFDFKASTHEASARCVPTPEDFMQLLRNSWQKRAAPVRLVGLGVRLAPENTTSTSPEESPQLSFENSLNLSTSSTDQILES